MDPMWIVLGIMLVFVIGMLSNKYSFGTVTVGCLVLLVLFGIQTPTEAFSGFGSGQIILMGGMFVISYAFGKTSVVDKVQALLFSNKGAKSDLAIAAIMLGFTALLCQFVTSVISVLMIMMSFLAALGHKSSVTASRMMLPVTFIASIFVARFPIGGGGASAHVMVNALLEGAGAVERLDITSVTKASLIPALLCLVYSIVSYKMMPDKEVVINETASKKDGPKLSKKDETIVVLVFVATIIGMLFGAKLGDIMYVIPALGVIIMLVLNVLTPKEVLGVLANDTLFMGAGVIALSNAMTNSGAGAWIGTQVQKLLGGSPAPIVLLVVFSVASIIMTTFMSNFVTMMVLSPIAIQVCAACGYDSRAVLLCIHFLVWAAVITPMASPATALAYGTAGLSVRDTIKWTVPAVLIATVSVIACSLIAYPM